MCKNNEEKQLEEQELLIDEVEKTVEEAPTTELGESGILVDEKGEDVNGNN